MSLKMIFYISEQALSGEREGINFQDALLYAIEDRYTNRIDGTTSTVTIRDKAFDGDRKVVEIRLIAGGSNLSHFYFVFDRPKEFDDTAYPCRITIDLEKGTCEIKKYNFNRGIIYLKCERVKNDPCGNN